MKDQVGEVTQQIVQAKATIGAGTFWGFGISGFFSENYQLIMGCVAILGLLVNWYYNRMNKQINEEKLAIQKGEKSQELLSQAVDKRAVEINLTDEQIAKLKDRRA